jgi:hypothetical protein
MVADNEQAASKPTNAYNTSGSVPGIAAQFKGSMGKDQSEKRNMQERIANSMGVNFKKIKTYVIRAPVFRLYQFSQVNMPRIIRSMISVLIGASCGMIVCNNVENTWISNVADASFPVK